MVGNRKAPGNPSSRTRTAELGIKNPQGAEAKPQSIFKKQLFWRAEKEVDALKEIGAKVVNWIEPEYPQTLLQIYDPPVMLYVRGNAEVLNAPSLSIVGTRRPTVYGTQMAERIARGLAARGLAIVSGLARWPTR